MGPIPGRATGAFAQPLGAGAVAFGAPQHRAKLRLANAVPGLAHLGQIDRHVHSFWCDGRCNRAGRRGRSASDRPRLPPPAGAHFLAGGAHQPADPLPLALIHLLTIVTI